MRKLVKALVILVWLLPGLAFARNIVVLGDSLSAAHGIDAAESWVTLLQKRLDERKTRYTVINASISGDTTANGLARLGPVLIRYRPEILIVELGGNDGLRGLSLDQMKSNIAAIIGKAHARGASVLLIGLKLPPNYGRRYVEKFHRIYRELTVEYRVPLVPFLLEHVATDSALMQADGIHPNGRAQALMLDNVWPVLRPMLVDSRTARAGARKRGPSGCRRVAGLVTFSVVPFPALPA